MDLSQHLNASQLDAVLAAEGPVLVIAGAGSGKTRVIEYRSLNLVRGGVPPESILLLTFTRRAAREMLSRAGRHDPRCGRVAGGTFHSFANGVLRRYAAVLGLADNFTILDQGDAEEAVGRCAARLGLYEDKKRFPKRETLQAVISKATNRCQSVEAVLRKEYHYFLDWAPRIEQVRAGYTEFKVNTNCVDYDDLLVYLQILLEQDAVRQQLSERYSYVMVDEYQDTNALQGQITYLLAERHRNVMAVGDDAQSIYRFRGSRRENILEFPSRFPGCLVVKLEENYRSTQPVLDVANAALGNMRHKFSKCLRSVRGAGGGGRPRLMSFKNDQDEAEWVSDRIKRYRDEGVDLSRQAVLFRSSFLSLALQVALQSRNIPFVVFGGLRFNETAHVKDVVAHLRVLLNPRDELAWGRLLKLLPGVGDATADRLAASAARADTAHAAAELIASGSAPSAGAAEGLQRVADVLRRAAGCAGVGPKFDVVLAHYEPLLRALYDDWSARLDDLNSLSHIAGAYSESDGLERFLSDVSIEPPEKSDGRSGPADLDDEKPLTLSTIHSAKGLEWETVFLLGVRDGVLPSSRSMQDEEDVEEEHRLFYVAVTRAKTHLILTLSHHGDKGGIDRLHRPSRFVEAASVLSLLDCERQQEHLPGAAGEAAATPGAVPTIGREGLLQRLRQMQTPLS